MKLRLASRLFLALVIGLSATAATTAAPAKKAPAKPFKVECVKDLTYDDTPKDPDRERHMLDVYRPVGKADCPVIFFVHGGAWMVMSKDNVLGIYGYGSMAESL